MSVLLRKKERDAEPAVGYREFWGITKRGDLRAACKLYVVSAFEAVRRGRGKQPGQLLG